MSGYVTSIHRAPDGLRLSRSGMVALCGHDFQAYESKPGGRRCVDLTVRKALDCDQIATFPGRARLPRLLCPMLLAVVSVLALHPSHVLVGSRVPSRLPPHRLLLSAEAAAEVLDAAVAGSDAKESMVLASATESSSDSAAPPFADDPMAATLDLLEWERLSQQVASFAQTRMARTKLEAGLQVDQPRETSELLHREMEEVYMLEQVLAKPIDLRGFSDIAPFVTHARKGGELDGESIVATGESLLSASNLLKVLKAASADAEEELAYEEAGDTVASSRIRELPNLFEGLPEQAALRLAIAEAFDETGRVRDSADPSLGDLRFARREMASAARRELGRLIQLKSDALASTQASVRDDRYVLQVFPRVAALERQLSRGALARRQRSLPFRLRAPRSRVSPLRPPPPLRSLPPLHHRQPQVLAKQKHKVAGTVRDVSASGATLFIEPKALEPTNTKLRQLAKKEEAIERVVRRQFSKRIGDPKVAAELLSLQDAITRVDHAAARARYSARLDGRPVTLCEPLHGGGLELPALRHPLLVWRSTAEAPDASRMVPMDMRVPPAVRAVVITGPNTGGKTICLKTLGLAALMAKAGLRVLCDDATFDGRVVVPCFDSVMADIGDDQSIVQSLSTFSAHVARMRRIMAHASAAPGRSLVLLDEVGSGTDPTEGSALGMAVLRALADDAALTLSTTHHGRLKTLKYSDAEGRFENACVEFDVASMAPTYRLLWGIPGRSNALAIAERLGLQEAVVEDARSLLSEESDASVEEVVGALQKQQAEQRQLNSELVDLKRQAASAQSAAQKLQTKLQADERQLRAQVEAEMAAELAAARATISELVQRAQHASTAAGGSAALRDVQQASQELARLGEKQQAQALAAGGKREGGVTAGERTPAPPSVVPQAPSLESLKAGDRVVVPRLGDTPVTVDSRKGNQLMIVYGGIRMKVKLKEVTRVMAAEPPPPPPPKQRKATSDGGRGTASKRPSIRFSSNTLDLRGQRPGEIEADLGRAIDRASSSGSLWVIHGHGTGSLKKRVRELLLEDPMVSSIQDAPQKDGGAGCTVAILR